MRRWVPQLALGALWIMLAACAATPPPAPGAKPLGPFYELETSSPAAALPPGQHLRHVHRTFHLQGRPADLDLLFCDLLTYATSSTWGILVRELDLPIVLVALQPLKALDYNKASTRMQLANDDFSMIGNLPGQFIYRFFGQF